MGQVLVKKDKGVKENSSDLRKREMDRREGERKGENMMSVVLALSYSLRIEPQ